MIVYLDASAFVPLVVAEATSASCRRIWGDADSVVGTRLLYVESMAALSRAVRDRRVPDESVHAALRRLEALWRQVRVIEIDADLAGRAGTAAWRFGLRGYDAVHCAAGALLSGDEDPDGTSEPNRVVAASADHDLLTAWRKLGLATFEPEPSPQGR